MQVRLDEFLLYFTFIILLPIYWNFISHPYPNQYMQGYSKRNTNAYLDPQQQNFEMNNTLGDLQPNYQASEQFMMGGPPMMNAPHRMPDPKYMPPMQQPVYPPFQPDPYAQQNSINSAVQQGFGGFGQYYFNALDPAIAKTNVPIKGESSNHMAIIVATLVLIAGFGAGIGIMVVKPEIITYGGVAIGVGYIAYLVSALTCSTIRGYITNLKKFEQYKQTYDKMVNGRGYFHFYIECYHYKTTGRKSKKRNKVVTHRASQNFYPNICADESGNVEGIKDVKQYVFVNYQKKMYFSDPRSQTVVQNAYNNFVSKNRRDTHQHHTNTFEIEGFEAQVGFCMQGASPHNSIVFYILSFLGLALPYACVLERSVSRYSINILKKLTY